MKTFFKISAIAALALAGASHLFGYWANASWPSGSRTFYSNLTGSGSAPSGGFTDGSSSWDSVATHCLNAWKPYMTRTSVSMTSTSTAAGSGNLRNEIAFSSTIYGDAFGSRVLAVTLSSYDSSTPIPIRIAEADILVNTSYTWNSYRGSIRNSPVDLQRVLTHELGHAIGLDHPDQADPVQNVSSIMNSVVSNTDALTADDISAAQFLYASTPAKPVIATQPTSINVTTGDIASLSVTTTSGTPKASYPLVMYTWVFKPAGGTATPLYTHNDAKLRLGPVQPYDAGTYQVKAYTPDDIATSNQVSVSVAAAVTSTQTRLANISTRGVAGAGSHSLIVGFNVFGSQPRRILIRGIGPSLSQFSVAGAVQQTHLTLMSTSGTTIAINTDWSETGAEAMADTFAAAGAFPLLTGSHDSALVVTLDPGSYTALVTPNNGVAEGLAIVEAYDIDPDTTGASRLRNLSTRGYVGTNSNVLIGGFYVKGAAPRTYLIRGVGDTLKNFDSTLVTLDDPTLEIYDSTNTLVRYTDDWDSPAFLQPAITAITGPTGAFALTDRQETVFWLTLNPGNYTVHLKGLDGGVGVGLFEVYEAADTYAP